MVKYLAMSALDYLIKAVDASVKYLYEVKWFAVGLHFIAFNARIGMIFFKLRKHILSLK